MDQQNTIVVWAGITITIAMVAWASAISTVYGPPPLPMTALERCAQGHDARNTSFCLALAQKADR